MKTLQTTSIASTLLVVGLLGGQHEVSAAQLCEVITCANGCYTTVSKAVDVPPTMNEATEANSACPSSEINEATNGQYLGFKVPLNTAPKPVALDCEPSDGNSVICESWPQGESITYSWSSSGSFVPDNGAGSASPFRGFSCTPGTQGTITVTAFSPRGASETLTQTVSCQ